MQVIKANKAPDTRGKLDNQRDLNKKPQFKKKFQKKSDEPKKKNSFKVEKKDDKPKISNGKKFKMLHGYSKTMKRNMKKYGLDPMAYSDSLADYKAIRKKRKAGIRKIQQAKHAASVLHKRTKGKAKGAKGKTPASKTVVKKAA